MTDHLDLSIVRPRRWPLVTSPRIIWDNHFSKFIMVVDIQPTSMSANPALYLAASDTPDACGTWFAHRLTFHGSQFPGRC